MIIINWRVKWKIGCVGSLEKKIIIKLALLYITPAAAVAAITITTDTAISPTHTHTKCLYLSSFTTSYIYICIYIPKELYIYLNIKQTGFWYSFLFKVYHHWLRFFFGSTSPDTLC